ncbi:Transcriptional regulator, contains XRE-family HTH domain [Oceanobacillus limi]|uniref:Transcriptional regulator, contains XRE-family HTH domain n=1 Tax=Oceanobacillus limi TaxID=930131 RepID=A0A1I0BNB4_9BACI|nr:helix-turn-helix transcriptional regulator [Oceanobacillus limi]SET08530.1 Transcriptional regulator, contains XRE-family HTH domain [Oceanobacillus limi]
MIGERIKKKRLDRGYSLTILAEMSGVSKSYLSYLERDLRTNPSLQVLTSIAKALDCSLEFLLGDEMVVMEKNLREDLSDEIVFYLRNAIQEGTINGELEDFRKYLEFLEWKAAKK